MSDDKHYVRAEMARTILDIINSVPIDWDHVEYDALYATRIGITDTYEALAVAIVRIRALCKEET